MTGETVNNSSRMHYIIAAAIVFFAMLSFGVINESTNTLLVLLVNIVLYFLVISLYFGVSLLAYHRRNYLLWGSGLVAFITGYLGSGLTNIWMLITGLSMILFASAIVGRLSYKQTPQLKIYIISLLAVVVFAVGFYAPVWGDLMKSIGRWSELFLVETRQNLAAMGYSAESIADSISSTKKVFSLIVHLTPTFLVLGSVMQFSIGYVIFLAYIDRKYSGRKRLYPFLYWKMPFGIMPVLTAALLMRFFGSEVVARIADNILAFLSVYYSITGLALIEFYLREFKFSKFLRVFFYISLFLTQFIGFFVAALLGLIDSFIDWRKVQQLSFDKE